jgi:AraC-like DNA-binding protein
MLFYRLISPSPALKQYIKCIWVLESPPQALMQAERVLPDGCVEMIFHYGDAFESSRDSIHFEQQSKTVISGQLLNNIFLRPTGSSKMIGVRFYPAGAYYFTGVPLKELINSIVDLDDMFTAEAKIAEELVNISESIHDKINVIESFILDRIKRNNIKEAYTGKAAEIILSHNGQITVKELSELAGSGERKLQRDFEDYIGLSPKQFARIARFQNAVKVMNMNLLNLTATAYECGYYDQAHFVKEFTEISGQTPSAYMKENHILSDYFTA